MPDRPAELVVPGALIGDQRAGLLFHARIGACGVPRGGLDQYCPGSACRRPLQSALLRRGPLQATALSSEPARPPVEEGVGEPPVFSIGKGMGWGAGIPLQRPTMSLIMLLKAVCAACLSPLASALPSALALCPMGPSSDVMARVAPDEPGAGRMELSILNLPSCWWNKCLGSTKPTERCRQLVPWPPTALSRATGCLAGNPGHRSAVLTAASRSRVVPTAVDTALAAAGALLATLQRTRASNSPCSSTSTRVLEASTPTSLARLSASRATHSLRPSGAATTP